jgi:hypothetical protein
MRSSSGQPHNDGPASWFPAPAKNFAFCQKKFEGPPNSVQRSAAQNMSKHLCFNRAAPEFLEIRYSFPQLGHIEAPTVAARPTALPHLP